MSNLEVTELEFIKCQCSKWSLSYHLSETPGNNNFQSTFCRMGLVSLGIEYKGWNAWIASFNFKFSVNFKVNSNSVYTLNDLQIHEINIKSGQGGLPDWSVTIKQEVVLPHSKIITEKIARRVKIWNHLLGKKPVRSNVHNRWWSDTAQFQDITDISW